MNSGPRKITLSARLIAGALIALIAGACGSADDPADEEVPAPPPHTERRAARTAAKADQFPYVATTELAALTARPAGDRDFVLADARTRVEFDEQHIPGAVNAPADVAPAALDRMRVEHDRRIIFYCNGPNCTKSKKAAAAARRAGYANLYVYDEGLPAWLTARLPVDGTPLPKFEAPGLTPAALQELVKSDPSTFVVDIRPASEFKAFHVAGAHNIPLDDVEARRAEIPATGAIAIVEHAGHQRAVAGRLFHALGFQNIRTLEGGTLAWQQANLPLDKAEKEAAKP